jgi:uncharacterized membrane protein YccC
MVYPSIRDWLFSIKTFAAAMIALYLGLYFQLPRPYWAMASVYFVSNPFLGATRSKALFRVLGTAIGASAAVLFVPPLVESPYLFSVAVALWTGTLLYLAMFDRTARSYVFLLAGYTMPLIALPAVYNPTEIFELAITRFEEIVLGIVCVSVVSGAVLPNRLAPTLIERTDGWFRDAAFYATETLSGRMGGSVISACRQRLATTVNGLELLLSQLAYDHTQPDVLARAHALRGRMQVMIPIMSSLADPLAALLARQESRVAPLETLLANTAKWFQTPLRIAGDAAIASQEADELRARLAQLQPPLTALGTWEGALLSNVLWRLKQLIDLWQDCCTLRRIIREEHHTWRPRFRHWRLGGTERHFDYGLMLFSTASTVCSIIVACVLWISSGWNDGASAIPLAAVASCFFAALDEPASQVFKFFTATSVSAVLAGIYLFALLPNVHDFPMLVIMFAGPFILAGTLMARPQFNLAAMLVAAITATFISIEGAYDADFLLFLNGTLATVAGLLYAYLWTRVTRPFGVELAAARLLRSSWADVVLSASKKPIEDQRNLAARMLDRLMYLIPRLAPTDDERHPSIESLRDLRVAFIAIDLRRLRLKLGGDPQAAIDGVLDGIHAYFQKCLVHKVRQPVPESLMSTIDAALSRVAAQGPIITRDPSNSPPPDDAAIAPKNPAVPARLMRDAMHALVGLRLSLFPAAIATLASPAAVNQKPGDQT